jgi:hypothetical protein
MKTQRLLVALTVLNIGVLMVQLFQMHRVEADSVAPVIRGKMLEIVDDQGKVRASIKLHPPDKTGKTNNGTPYPETVMFRLIDPEGRPFVKMGGSEEGSGLALLGETDTTAVILKAERTECSMKMSNNNGRQQLIKP